MATNNFDISENVSIATVVYVHTLPSALNPVLYLYSLFSKNRRATRRVELINRLKKQLKIEGLNKEKYLLPVDKISSKHEVIQCIKHWVKINIISKSDVVNFFIRDNTQ